MGSDVTNTTYKPSIVYSKNNKVVKKIYEKCTLSLEATPNKNLLVRF